MMSDKNSVKKVRERLRERTGTEAERYCADLLNDIDFLLSVIDSGKKR